jgi:soluble lytic murein transglycosylase-like protein
MPVATYTRAQLQAYAAAVAQEHGVPVDVFQRQIGKESNWDVNVRSPAGALGVAQLMPATARGLGVNPLDPLPALNAAARLMGTYIRQYHGSVRDALIAYNAGPGAVGKPLPAETKDYLDAILNGANPTAAGAAPSASSGGGGNLFAGLVGSIGKALLYVALILGGAALIGIGVHRAVGGRA